MNISNKGPAIDITQAAAKADAVKKETTLDKALGFAKEKTQKGTLVGDHYIAVGAGTLVGGAAAISGVSKLADAVPAVEKALEFAFETNGKLLGGAASLGAAALLAEDAVQSFKEGSTIKGGAEALGATVAGLGGVELIGRQYNVPYAKEALSASADFMSDNAMAMGGSAAVAGGAFAIKKGVDEMMDGKMLKGGAIAAGGAVGVLGGAELVGRQFNIPVMKEALTGPAKAIFTSKAGLAASGGAVALTGAGAAIDGVRRLSTQTGILNDVIGVAEVTAGITAATGGASLIGLATGNDKLKSALANNMEFVGAAAALGSAAALGKYTVNSVKEDGLGLINTATGTGAALAALGGVELAASQLGVAGLDKVFSKGWQPVLGVGLGAAAYKLGSNAVSEFKEGNMGNAAGQAGLSFMSGAGSAALIGESLNIPIIGKMGSKTIEIVGEKILSPVFEFAVKNPVLTLGAVAIAGGAGAYAYYSKDAEAEAAKAAPKK